MCGLFEVRELISSEAITGSGLLGRELFKEIWYILHSVRNVISDSLDEKFGKGTYKNNFSSIKKNAIKNA